MEKLLEKLEGKISKWRSEIYTIGKQYGETKVADINVSQLFGGLRGVKALICDTSEVPNDKGLIIRGYPLKELLEKSPEEIFYLLLTGELPNADELDGFATDLKIRKYVPHYVWDVLKAMPKDSHPMAMLSTAIISMQRESLFARRYEKGIKKEDHWKPALQDAFNLIAKLPAICAGIYRIRFNKGELIQPDPDMDLTGDYTHMMGLDVSSTEFYNMMKLFLVCHVDHEGGNVSAYTSIVVNSALSDLYYTLSAGLNGLAGPLHGLANQEVVKWIIETMNKYNGAPSKEQIIEHANATLQSGQVVPGYGHAVLRIVDPRFEAFYEFGKIHCINEPIFQTVMYIFETVPDILKKIQKIKDPWPNVDAVTGSLLYHYGIREFSYYTVIFALSRALGISAQTVVNRALHLPIVRPKSVTIDSVKKLLTIN